ncbi:MAG: hypothetical protein FWJ85_13375 [Solitalea sp.]
MKRLVFVLLACVVSFSGTYAQVTATSTATINIANLLSITSNVDPTFNIDTEEEFATGETLTLPGALTVTSTADYDVTVATSGPDFTNGTDGIPVGNVTIDATNGGGTAVGAQPLSETPVNILEEASAGLSQDIDLTYVLAGGDHLLNVPDGAYVTTLTFTLSVD